ncbi:MAG TPA: c-type cytochrome [Bacteroidales bacterium]|nr:c-type cytochrome [Bacteroidales bacterium]
MNNAFGKNRRKSLFSISAAFLVLISSFGFSLQAQETGKDLFQVCTACHTIGKGKLIGPDLSGVTERHDRSWLKAFINNSQEVIASGDEYAVKLFEEYNKIPMPPNNFTDEQLDILLDYIANYDPEAEASAATTTEAMDESEAHAPAEEVEFMAEKEGPFENLQISFIISMILILVSLVDLFITRLIKARMVHIMVILISLAIVIEVTVKESQNLGRQQYYSPDQPIAFSHRVHAADNRIDCRYCHFTVDESRHAGIPPTQLCMNCHNVIKQGKYTGTEEIAKIYTSMETGRPIKWIKVHNLPDHAYFNHAQHVNVGKLACEECHGDVKTMDRIMQVNDLSMGWCINCHRNTEVQFYDNEFYTLYEETIQKLESGKINRVTVDAMGGSECQKCHY